MKARLLPALLLLTALPFPASARKNYQDSLKQFRQQYTTDLYKIISQDTAYIRFFPADPAYVVVADVQLLSGEKPFKMITSSGKSKEAQKYALLTFTLKGKQYRLYAYQLLMLKAKAETANDLFLPFTDQTNGNESYGGGRYIDLLTTGISKGKVVIDFNKAYNPYCAFTTGYNCPVPPRENSLPLRIRAGEQYRKEKFRHE